MLKLKRSLLTVTAITLLTLLALSVISARESFSGQCVSVTDGDTVRVLRENREIRVRLYGIDCPEKGQAYGTQAKKFTSGRVFGKNLRVEVMDIDRYGRTVGKLFVKSTYVNREIIRAGFAWHYKKYSSDADLADAEKAARAAKRGLWADPKAQPPWEWRKSGRK